MAFCKHCGAKLPEESVDTCPKCHKPLQTTEQVEEAQKITEHKEQKEEPASLHFCRHCGEKVVDQDATHCPSCEKEWTPASEQKEEPPSESLMACPSCGTKITNFSLKYCPSCGSSIDEVVKEKQNKAKDKPKDESKTRANLNEKKWTMKTKLIISFVAIFLILIASVFVYGYQETNPANQLEAFEQAVEKKDGKAMAHLLVPANEEMKITEENGQQLVQYLHENPDVKDAMMKTFREQIRSKGNTKMAKEYPQLVLKEHQSKWLVFKAYKYEIQPYYAAFNVNFKGTTISVDGKEKGKTKKDNQTIKVGPFAPGKYEVVAHYKGEYGEEKKKVTLDFYEDLAPTQKVPVKMVGSGVNITSNIEDAEVYVNDESIGETVGEIDTYGPVKRDGSVEIYAVYDYPFGEGKSEPVVIKNQKEIHLEVKPDPKTVYDSLAYTIERHSNQWVLAYGMKNISYFSYILDEEYLDKQLEYYEKMSDANKYWVGDLDYIRLDKDSLSVSEKDGKIVASINGEVHVTGEVYDYFDYESEHDGIETGIESDSSFWKYNLTYDETDELWYITKMTVIDGIGSGNVETIR